MLKEYEFSLTMLPMLKEKPEKDQLSFLKSMSHDAPRCGSKQPATDTVMGMRKILAQSPFDRPKSPARNPKFKFLSFYEARKNELTDMNKTFVSSYRDCIHILMQYFSQAPSDDHRSFVKHIQKAPTIIWPPGCYVPSRHQPIAE